MSNWMRPGELKKRRGAKAVRPPGVARTFQSPPGLFHRSENNEESQYPSQILPIHRAGPSKAGTVGRP